MEYLLNLRDGSSLCTGVDRDGASPLHYAAIKTDKSILTILLRQVNPLVLSLCMQCCDHSHRMPGQLPWSQLEDSLPLAGPLLVGV